MNKIFAFLALIFVFSVSSFTTSSVYANECSQFFMMKENVDLEVAEAQASPETKSYLARIRATYDGIVSILDTPALHSNLKLGFFTSKKLLFLAPKKVFSISWGVFWFEPNIKGIQKEIIQPFTHFIRDMRLKANASEAERALMFAEFQYTLVGIILKSTKIAPQMVVEVVPSAAGVANVFIRQKNPEVANEVVVSVIKDLLASSWEAMTAKGLTLQQRMSLISIEESTLNACSAICKELGLVELMEEIELYRASSATE